MFFRYAKSIYGISTLGRHCTIPPQNGIQRAELEQYLFSQIVSAKPNAISIDSYCTAMENQSALLCVEFVFPEFLAYDEYED
jgi:hypothetical protein